MRVRRNFTEVEIEFLRTNYSEQGGHFCAKALNRKYNSITAFARTHGICVSKEHLGRRLKTSLTPGHIFQVPVEPFTTVFTNTSVYLLGLLWADGFISNYVNCYTVGLDSTHPDADDFIPLFSQLGKWGIYSYTKKNFPTWKRTCSIKTNNRLLYNFLEQHGYAEKTGTPESLLQLIPAGLHYYWFRGLFDGDGCLSFVSNRHPHMVIAGPGTQDWTYLTNKLDIMQISYTVRRRSHAKGQIGSTTSCYSKHAIKFLDYIYQGDRFGLKRKYERYLFLKTLKFKPQVCVVPSRIYNTLPKDQPSQVALRLS